MTSMRFRTLLRPSLLPSLPPCLRRYRRLAALTALLALLLTSGCRFLSDEFTRLDRAGPVIDDPRVAGDQDRP
ncbi:MAG: hypothetical protein H6835_00605 [Planctomycetes bacterium]|nr:hypothetical protein [Planctomycetota bacterium]